MSSKSTPRKRSGKSGDRPEKPYPGFPLYAHPLGYWSRKVNGKLVHFGRWGRVRNGEMVRVANDGWAEALAKHNLQYPDLKAGRKPRAEVQ